MYDCTFPYGLVLFILLTVEWLQKHLVTRELITGPPESHKLSHSLYFQEGKFICFLILIKLKTYFTKNPRNAFIWEDQVGLVIDSLVTTL